MANKFKSTIVKLLIISIVFSPFGLLKTQASEPAITLPNNYEIATAGANLDSEVDQNGNTYVVYDRSGNVYIVKNRGSEQLVGAGSTPAIALDQTGAPHVAYISGGSVIYEIFDGDWDNEINIGIGTGASYVDIDLDSNSKAHVFFRAKYYDDNYVDLVYASNTTGAFTVAKSWNGFYDDYGGSSGHMEYYSSHPVSIKIDSANNYHLAYWFNNIDKAPGWIDRTYYVKYETSVAGESVDKVGDFALYKNSLTVDALGRANVVYGATKHGLISGGTWIESNLGSVSNSSIASNDSAIAIAYVGAGVFYYENRGSGAGETIQIDPSGGTPVVSMNNTNRFVYYTKAGKIYLATDKTLYNTPVITGVDEGASYNTDREISWDHGDGSLNGVPVSSPLNISTEGVYNITVTNTENKSSSVNFSIDKTDPILTIGEYNTLPTNQDISVTASTNEGTLNAESHTFSANGSFEFVATDAAGNTTSKVVDITNIDKTAPAIKIGIYTTSPTNQNITVTASVDGGTLNSESHTFTENGSFTFTATDAAGNISTSTVTILNIDKVSPIITINPFSTSWTKEDVTVTASANEGMLNTTSHIFTENGSFDFIATDPAGNQTTTTVTVNNIDKIKPTGVTIQNPINDSYIRQTVQFQAISSDEESGIEKVEFFTEKSGKLGEDTTAPFEISWDTTSVSDGEQDIWVSVYDKAGNTSDSRPTTVNIDNTPPVITIADYETSPTNSNITVSASVNEGTLNAPSHIFTENGSFVFTAMDTAGNSTTKTVTITNIDRTGPAITISEYSTLPTNQDITVTASVTEGTLNTATHTFTENGSFDFVATDSAGNQTTETVRITNIDKTSPVIEIGIYSTLPTNQNITVTATANEGTLNVTSHTFTENDSFEFIATDDAGNIAKYNVTIFNIDKVAPTITIGSYSENWTKEDITVTASTNEGTLNVTSHTFTENGSFTFTATDQVGNVTHRIVTISNIDKEGPGITLDGYNTEPTNQDVTVAASVTEGTLNSTSHTFAENGSFTFVATDSLGNQTSKVVTINNIDKSSPNGSITSLTVGGFYGGVYTLTASTEDGGSGIQKVEFWHASEPTLIGTIFSAPFSIDWNTALLTEGEHEVWSVMYDLAGNKTVTDAIKVNIDNTAPIISIEPYSTDTTTGTVTVYAKTNEGTLNASSHTFAENGSFDFIATDAAGNKTTKTVTISNIQKPNSNSIPVSITSNNSDSTISSTDNGLITGATANAADTALSDKSEEKIPQEETKKTEGGETNSVKGEDTKSDSSNKYIYWLILLAIIIAGSAFYINRHKQQNR